MSELHSASIRHRVVRVVGHRRAALSRAAAAVVALGIAGTASAQNVWVGPVGTPSPWETASNWSLGSVPAGEVASINNGGIAQITSTVPEILALQLGSDAGLSGSVVHDSGLLPLVATLVLGNSPNPVPTPAGAGTYTMNGGTITGSDFFIGAKGAGTFNMNGGVITSGSNMRVSDDAGSTGVLNMSGGEITLPSFLLVGHGNGTNGTFNLSGGTVTVANYNIGQHPTARGFVNQTGGFVNNTANLVVAEISREDNVYDLSGGTLRINNTNSNGSAFIGSSQGIGTLRVRGTGNAQIDGHIFLAGGATAFGTFNMSGGTVALGLNKPEGGFLVVGENGQATATISGGVFGSDFLQLGRRANATSRGQLAQTGGNVTVRRSMNVGGLSGNDNYYEVTGGTLNLSNELGGGTNTFGETQPGLHVARFSVNPGTFTPVTQYSAGRLTVDGTAVVNIAGGLYNSTGFSGVINLDGGGTQTVQLPGGQGLIEMKGGTLNAGSFVNGGAANAGSFNNGGATASYVQSGGVATLGPVTGTGQVAVSGGTMNVNSLSQGTATVSGNGTVRVAPNGTSAATSRVNTLDISGSGQLDLTNNALVIDYTGPTPLANVRADIVSGYAGGAWNGPGINSSTAAGGNTHAIGYAEGSELSSIPPIFGTVDADAILAVYTRYGDANLDQTVNLADFNRLASNFGTPSGADWSDGDFNFDGIVNLQDFNRLAANFGLSAGPDGVVDPEDWAALASAIPEPSGILGLSSAAALLVARRRRTGR